MMLSGITFMFNKLKKEDKQLCKMFDQIDLSVDKLTKLSRNLTQTARSSNPQETEILNLSVQIPIIVDLLHKHPDVYKCKLTANNIPSVSLSLNQVLFEQSLINLVVNAAQAADEHAIIEVAVHKDDDSVLLEVHDNGPGIPHDVIKTIFEPGYTTKKSGSGLGMLSVSAFAKSCNGEISINKSYLIAFLNSLFFFRPIIF
jgi:two-component system sensor histidine kinase HydH